MCSCTSVLTRLRDYNYVNTVVVSHSFLAQALRLASSLQVVFILSSTLYLFPLLHH